MYEFLGFLVLIAFALAIGSFMVNSWNTFVIDARKEDKRVYERRIENEVERRVDEAIRSAEYRVHYRPIELINESDINWGEPERRIKMYKEVI